MYKKKKCRVCGEEFIPNSSRQLDCNKEIEKICVVCGRPFKSRCSKNDTRSTCSKECQNAYAHSRAMQSYSESAGQRKCKECGKLFFPMTNTQMYCTDVHKRNCVICGAEFTLNPKTFPNEWPTTCSKKCAAELAHRNISPEAIEYSIAEKRRARLTPEQYTAYQSYLDDPEGYLKSKSENEKVTLHSLASSFGIADCTIGQHIIANNLQKYITYFIPVMEQEVVEFIHSISDTEVVMHDRDVIAPNEIDIWLPEFNLGIECNPTATHNSSRHFIASYAPMASTYHAKKSAKGEEAGIFIFHLFSYEWAHRRDVIESMLRNLLDCSGRRIYARQCDVRQVDASTAFKFLETNHRQGGVHSKYRYGLYYLDELVAVMTFDKMRHTIGTGKEDLSNCYELVRFCSCLNTSVIGGASRLFSHFVKDYCPERIRSFSDRAHTKGTLYSTLGFTKVRTSLSGYVWVDYNTDVAYSRINAQKHNIKKFLNDDTVDLTQTESQIMESYGYVRVYDSGTITWEWKASQRSNLR